MGFLEDLGNGLAAAASTVGDIVEGAVDAAADTAENVVDGVCDTVQDGINSGTGWLAANGGPILGSIGNVAGGAVVGLIEGGQDLADDALHLLRDQGAILGSLLRLDVPRLLEETLNYGIDLLDFGIDILRSWTGGYLIAAVADNFNREDLRAFVETLIRERLASDPELENLLDRLNISTGNWGLKFTANNHVMMFDTATPGVSKVIRDMHESGALDLYALAGLLSFDSFSFGRARTMVKVIGFDGTPILLPTNRLHISKFLDGADTRLQIFAISPRALNDCLKVATKKFKKMGILLSWNDSFNIPALGRMTTHEITRQSEYFLVLRALTTDTEPPEEIDLQAEYFQRSGIKDPAALECPVEAVTAFHYALNSDGREQFGRTCGRVISEGADVGDCVTPDRSDTCCITVSRLVGETRTQGSGVVYRDIFAPYVSRYVLGHEIGHYFGLCHFGHDGVQNMMFSNAGWQAGQLNPVDPGLWQYYLHSEPEFTHEDAKNVWRFIVDQIRPCL